jgi:MazG family protein
MADDTIQQLLAIMARLRAPDGGCPWDVEQTFATIAPYTIEEAYEVADAIHRGDADALRDELGDLLFQVVFHARMAEEAGSFAFTDVVDSICNKMIRRHPHVFGEASIADAEAQTRAWERHKAAERAAAAPSTSGDDNPPASVLDDVPQALPALLRGHKLQRRATLIGFDWPNAAGALDKLDEELAELREAVGEDASAEAIADEMGDVLFCCVNVARKLGLDAEEVMRRANRKFERRFRQMEALARGAHQNAAMLSLDELDALWQRVKKEER